MSGQRAGVVGLVGRPNSGKSTLMNSLLPEKVAIVSDKPQTTRHRLVGILTEDRGQIVFYDTPGIHKPQHRLNRRMVHEAVDALDESDVIALVIDVSVKLGSGDRYMTDLLQRSQRPKVALLNKIDVVRKGRLLPIIRSYADSGLFAEIIPISALTGDGLDRVLEVFFEQLPEGEPLYEAGLLTTQPERFLVAERIREKVLEQTRQELPFASGVVIESWQEDEDSGRLLIQAALLVERSGQKAILIGQGGRRIKAIGMAARQDLESYLGRRLRLELYVRQQQHWREDARVLAAMDRDRFAL